MLKEGSRISLSPKFLFWDDIQKISDNLLPDLFTTSGLRNLHRLRGQRGLMFCIIIIIKMEDKQKYFYQEQRRSVRAVRVILT